jgi:hypothetical protein
MFHMSEPTIVRDRGDEQPFGELHRLLEKLCISCTLMEECIEEYETILGISPFDRRSYFFG